jgi:hypothetical protein
METIVYPWIDAMCERHPALMAEVLTRPFSRLSTWIDWDAAGGECGCLIGTTALVAGIAESEGDRDACPFLAATLGQDEYAIAEVGMAVFTESVRLAHGSPDVDDRLVGTAESDRQVVDAVKQRIAVNLAVRESAQPVEVPA